MSQREPASPTSIVSAASASTTSTPSLGLGELERLARAIAASGLFGLRTPEQAMALMAIAQAEGLPAALAARDYHIIDGRPSLRADAMLARFQRAGGRVKWEAMTAEKCAAVFVHPSCPDGVRVEWTLDDARRAGLATRQNWIKYPRAMLRARVISEGVRACYPDPIVGVYTPEEISDIVADERGEVVAVTDSAAPVEPALDEWLVAVEAATSVDELRETYRRGLEAIQDAETRRRFINAVKARKAALEAAEGEVR